MVENLFFLFLDFVFRVFGGCFVLFQDFNQCFLEYFEGFVGRDFVGFFDGGFDIEFWVVQGKLRDGQKDVVFRVVGIVKEFFKGLEQVFVLDFVREVGGLEECFVEEFFG